MRFMYTCRDVAELLSLSLDHGLTPLQRLGMSLHLFLCGACARHHSQMLCLVAVFRKTQADPDTTFSFLGLSGEARERIRNSMRDCKS